MQERGVWRAPDRSVAPALPEIHVEPASLLD